MKIISLTAENIKRLHAVQITPDGNLVQITGANGQGKTSVLDAIWWALQGVKNIQKTPIREGEEKAMIKLDLGEYVVTRRFTAKDGGGFTTSLAVEDARVEGAKLSSPQKVLDNLLGELTFDPLEFTRMSPDRQANALQRLAPDFDFAENAKAIKSAFEDRTFANRKAREAEAAADALSSNLPADRPSPVSVGELAEQLNAATNHNSDIERREEKRKAYKEERAGIEAQILALHEKLSEMDAMVASWPPLPDRVDTQTIQSQLEKSQEINEMSKRFDDVKAQRELAVSARQESAALTKSIEDAENAAARAIAAAKMPVEGLSIQDGGVFLDGLPFNQASDAKQLRASIGIAMALNPKLRVIRVRDGSLLDAAALKSLSDMVGDADYQVWIERVDDSGQVGFVIEDGQVKQRAPDSSVSALFDGDLA